MQYSQQISLGVEIVHIIKRCKNKKVEAVYEEYNSKHPENEPRVWKKVTRQETYAFLQFWFALAQIIQIPIM